MKFGQAINAGFSNYANFKGRARRSAYWYLYLFYVLVAIAATIFDTVLFSVPTGQYGPLYTIVVLGMLLPIWGASVRRMHDVDKSGWFILVPIYNLVLLCTDGTRGQNRFGEATK